MFAGRVNNRFSIVFANLNTTRIINGSEVTNSNTTHVVIV